MIPIELLAVCVGGALGAVLRFWITLFGARVAPNLKIPLPTLFINLSGSAALGGLYALIQPPLDAPIQDLTLVMWGVGFCGAYTTFSSFCTETIALLKSSRPLAVGYLILTLGGSILAFWAALSLAS